MNWLAHLLLADNEPLCRIGSLLPDLTRKETLGELSASVQGEVERHHRIDAFTDAHPIVRRSIQRIEPPFRRYGGVLVDVMYDHFLARDWSRYSTVSLDDFASEFYASFAKQAPGIPAEVYIRLQRMKEEDWLGSYRQLSGISITLTRISSRLRRPFDLAAAIPIFQREYEQLAQDFNEFFPQLVAYAAPDASTVRRTPKHV